jgi:tetratricopeptide (TPR) repeat protein
MPDPSPSGPPRQFSAPGNYFQPQDAPRPFLDVPALLELSEPVGRVSRLWFLGGGMLLILVMTVAASSAETRVRDAVHVLAGLAMLGLMAGLSGMTVYLVRKFRQEQQAVESAGELVQLRHWPQAAMVLEQYLSRPARTHQLRTQALIYLASVLNRYHRFADAITVQEYLLDSGTIDLGTAYGLKLGRAMAILREDHLFDADRAISELRRIGPDDIDSAGLALVEIYRDVKTGHPAEAIELFEQKLPALREQLGHRVADAYALVARAYDLLNRPADAQAAFENATLLAPPGELYRRYPEVEKLKDRYQPAVAPPEAA